MARPVADQWRMARLVVDLQNPAAAAAAEELADRTAFLARRPSVGASTQENWRQTTP